MALLACGDAVLDADLVIFDKDGTLIDFHRLWAGKTIAGIERLVAALGADGVVRTELYAAFGYDPVTDAFAPQGPVITASMAKLYTIAATVLYQHGMGWLDAELAVEKHLVTGISEAFGPEMIQPVADLRLLFDALVGAGVRIAVITSDDHAPSARTLRLLGVEPYVGMLIGADDPYAHKPAPDAVLAVCAYLGVAPGRAVMVGDSTTDMLMATRAGVGLRVAVLTGVMERSVLAPGADIVLESIAEIRVAANR